MNMLAVDIGNTNITVGLFGQSKLIKAAKVGTALTNQHSNFFKSFLASRKIQKIVLCSVVPKAVPSVSKKIHAITGVRVLVCGKDIKAPIKNLYRDPRQVGQDRLVNAYAGLRFFGKPLIVVDFGTAITFDVVSKNGAYLGGIIVPGVDISFDSLFERTALLPLVKFKVPKSLIGRDTVNSIRSGVVYGYASLCDGLIKRLREKIGVNVKAIATGGYSEFISKYAKEIYQVDKNLTLKGLNLLAVHHQ